MPSKTEEYLALAQRTANGLTRYWESWTDYLTTASRLYKYPFADQLMIYAQRPDATACADYDIWNNRMNRYVRRGSKGIALLDESSGFPRLHYVFDVSDTGVRRNSRDPDLWQYNDDLKQPVSEMLAATYGISGERVSQQLADVAGKLVADYWDNNSEDISAIVDGSLLMDYDEAGVEMQFKSAAAISVTYTLLERCGFEPDGYFDKDSFQAIYDFSTPDTVYTLGAAVSDISREVLRTVERAVKTTIRRRNNERSQHEYEQQSELHADRGLSSPEPDSASAEEPAGQVRQDAPELSETAAPGSVPHDAPEREPVPDPDRTGADRSSDEEATDGRSAGEEPGPGQGEESDGVGTAHEQPTGAGRGSDSDGTDLQLSFLDAVIPTEAQQIEHIDRAESEKSPSAFVLSQAEIENELRKHGSGFQDGKQRIIELYQTQPDRKLRAKALAKEYGIGGHSHDYLDGSSGFVNHDGKGLEFDHYPDHQKVTLSWTQVEKYIDLMIQSDRYLTDKEKEHRAAVQEAERQLPMLDGDAAAEYNALKEQYPNTLIGFELGGYFLFYDKDAITVKEVFRSNLLSQENALGKVKVTGFLRREWVAKSQKLWAEGNSIYLAGQGGDGTHHQTKYLREEDYLPIGIIIKLDGRDFRVDHVNFMFKSVSLQDMDLTNSGQPIFRVERLPNIRELYEQQQDEIIDVSPEKAVDYKVGDEVVVDLPTRTIEGKIGYVGETDVRIDTSAHGQSWDNEVLNKQQFEDGLRRDEPTPDEELDKLPISVEVNGEWQNFPDAVAADEALNAEPMPEAAGNFHITDDNLGVGGPKQKFARNIEAIQTLRTLEQEHKTNMTSGEQIDAALAFIHKLTARRDAAYNGLLEQLAEQGIRLLDFAHMEEESRTELEKLFRQDYLPLLSSFIISKKQAFPFLKNKGIYAVAVLSTKAEKKKIGIVPCGNEIFPRLVPVPGRTGCFILSEELILHFLPLLYKGYKVTSKTLARITRNADIDADLIYDEDLNYRDHMAEVVKKRKKLAPVRLELSREIDEEIIQSLCKNLKLDPKRVFEYDSPLDHSFLFQIEDQLRSHTDLFFAPRHPQPSPALDERKPIIPQILEEDKLIHYPYESIRPFLQLLHEAACDPDVVSIKMTLYRLANHSKVVDALVEAAENGKQVDVLVELKARFDEENNIEWSRLLERAGCHVVYGIEGLKVHSKLCLITRKTKEGISFITQIGTGNYNEKTSRLYTDLSFLTASKEIGLEATEVFRALDQGETVDSVKNLLVAPHCLQNRLLNRIDGEIKAAARGEGGYIGIKINSLTDKVLINKLIEASQAGVYIDMVVRGICCLRAGVPDETENIHIISIVGRYLEHSRIYIFGQGERARYYIGSADWMTRSTLRRVEIAAPVTAPALKARLQHIFDTMLADNCNARVQQPDGSY